MLQRSRSLDMWKKISIPPVTAYTGVRLSICRHIGFHALEHYPLYLESPYHTYYPWEEDVPYWIWSQRSNALDIEVEIQFLGSRTLPFPSRVTLTHIWTTHGRKMFPVVNLNSRTQKAYFYFDVQCAWPLALTPNSTWNISLFWVVHTYIDYGDCSWKR
jgi:hypothetical protein